MGEFQKIEDDAVRSSFEKAKVLLKKNKVGEAYKIFTDIGLTVYYKTEYKEYAEKAKFHFEGIDFDRFIGGEIGIISLKLRSLRS